MYHCFVVVFHCFCFDLLVRSFEVFLCCPNFGHVSSTLSVIMFLFRAGPNALSIQPIHKWDVSFRSTNRFGGCLLEMTEN